MDRFLQNSNVVRLIAIVLAIILWFAVGPNSSGTNGVSPTYSKSFTGIPVSIVSDKNQFIVSNSVAKVNVVVTGGTLDITQLQTSLFSIKAIADIRGYSTGIHQVAISLQNIPDTVHYQIIPDVTTVSIDQKVSKTVPVKVGIVGQPGNGFTTDTPTLSPTEVDVTGPLDAVNQVKDVQAIVSVEGETKTISQNIPLVAVGVNGKQVDGVDLSRSSVSVTLPIHSPTKDVTLEPITTGIVKDGYVISKITVSPDHATIGGPESILAKLGTTFTLPAVDVTGLNQDKTFSVPLEKPNGILTIQPKTVNVTVKVSQSTAQMQSLTFSVPVTFTNLPDGMTAKLQENFSNVDVTVTGDTTRLGQLTLDQMQVLADLSGQSTGTHIVTLQAKVPNDIQVATISPSSVHVTITQKAS